MMKDIEKYSYNQQRPAFFRRAVKLTAMALCVVLLFTFLPGTVIYPEAEATSATIAKLRDLLKKNEQEQAALKREIAAAKNDINSMLKTKDYLDQQIALKEQNIEITEKLINELDKEIANLKTRLAHKETNLEKEYEKFRVQLRLSYEDKDISLFEILFSSESLMDFLVNSERTAILLEFQTNYINDLKLQAEDLNNLKAQHEEYLSSQQTLKVQLETAKADLEASKNYALSYIKTKEREMRKNEEEYQKLVKANEELDAELEKQLKELAAKSQRVYVGGQFIWPLDHKFNRISSYFGKRTFNGITEFHKALDIPANAGSNIYAANGGSVVTATYHYSYGNYVVIDHGGGKATLYAHCSKLLVKVGDNVNQGDVIAKVGTTGYSSGNHLHFEVRINGTAVNPLDGYVVKP
jgi:murein DD-endopeptidase MepM/ murein hydrolase activator NlpD